jgi:maltose O-acetyltransferase
LKIIGSLLDRLNPRRPLQKLVADGLRLGRGTHIGPQCIIDPSHCWLITLEDGVTLAPRVIILAHDASCKKLVGYTRIGRVTIGKNAFIGAGAIILPGVSIGENAVIGAGSVVTKNVPAGKVAVGNPARVVDEVESLRSRQVERMKTAVVYPEQGWTPETGITAEGKRKMAADLENSYGYVV